MIELRPYQLSAVESVRNSLRKGNKKVLLVAPTGSGKTVVSANIIHSATRKGKKTLFLAHRRELINQCYKKLIEYGLSPHEVSVLMGADKRFNPFSPVQVASVDTLRNRTKPEADLIIIDECHRSMSKTHLSIIEQYPNAVIVGLTATPYRADGQGLGNVYQDIVVVSTIKDLIAERFLVEPEVWSCTMKPSLEGVQVKRGDYVESQLDEAMNQPELIHNIVDHWLEKAKGVRTVAFASSIQHSKAIVEQFKEKGVAAEHLDGETPTPQRDAILARLEAGETHVVSNCGVLVEGWDQPSAKCCILARPTKSKGMYLQQAGRILRPFEEQKALILDHAGNAMVHGLPQDMQNFELTQGKQTQMDRKTTKECPDCHWIIQISARECPCGHLFVAKQKEFETRDVDLELLNPDERLAKQRIYWDSLCKGAVLKGYKVGWIYHSFKRQWGEMPPYGKGFACPPECFTDEQKAKELEKLRRTCEDKGYNRRWIHARYFAKFKEWPGSTFY